MPKKKTSTRPDYAKCVTDIQSLQRKVALLQKTHVENHQEQQDLIDSLAQRIEEIATYYKAVIRQIQDLENEASALQQNAEQLRKELRQLTVAIASASTGDVRVVSARALAISRSVLDEEVRYYVGCYVDTLRAVEAIRSASDNPACHRQAEVLLQKREGELKELEIQLISHIALEADFDAELMESVESIPAPAGQAYLTGKVARVDTPAFLWHDSGNQPQVIPAKVATYGEPGSPHFVNGFRLDASSSHSFQEGMQP